MKTGTIYGKIVTLSAAALLLAGASGCTRTVTLTEEKVVYVDRAQPVPGAVEMVWEEPMVDVVDVPPGLDPEGHYYRPAHQAVVEIYQGRWRYNRPQGGTN